MTSIFTRKSDIQGLSFELVVPRHKSYCKSVSESKTESLLLFQVLSSKMILNKIKKSGFDLMISVKLFLYLIKLKILVNNELMSIREVQNIIKKEWFY